MFSSKKEGADIKQLIFDNVLTDYYIYSDGRLYSKKTNRFIKGTIRQGYVYYDLRVGKKRYSKAAHRLVAEYYLENADNKPLVNHIDGDKLNNNIDNLEWVTYSENNSHAYETGLKQPTTSKAVYYEGDLPKEEWRQFEDTNYYLSNYGRVLNKKYNTLLQGSIKSSGYREIQLTLDGKKRSFLLHRLLYSLFYPLREDLVVNHKNGNKADNRLENLEAVSASKNVRHAYYKLQKGNKKKVLQVSPSKEVVAEYDSIAKAARHMGVAPQSISSALKRKGTSCGYYWEYKEEHY